MARLIRLSLALLLLVTALACAKNASVTESQCTAGDWETIGQRDGAQGWASSRLLAHQDACVPHGVTPDRVAYQRGWKLGIAEFCDPHHGFELGQSGVDHENVCPVPHRAAFLAAYERGYAIHQAHARVEAVQSALASKTVRLETIDEEIALVAAAQLDPLLMPAQRVQLVVRVKTLFEEKSRLANEIPQLEEELRVRTRELEQIDAAMASTSY